MTDIVPNEQTYEDYDVVSSSSGPFAFNFQYFEKTDLDVTVDGVSLAQSGFTITPGAAVQFGGYDGGSVTLVTAVSNSRVVIARSTVTKRTSNLSGANLTADAVNTALNKLTMMLADNRRDLTRAILATYGNIGTAFNPADVAALAAKVTEIDELHAIIDDLVILGALGPDIQSLAGITSAITSNADNLSDIQGAIAAAATATTKATEAEGFRDAAQAIVEAGIPEATPLASADLMTALDEDALFDGRVIEISSYHLGKSKGGGEFVWDASSTETADDGHIFEHDSLTTGRFKRKERFALHTYDFGAIHDDSTNASDMARETAALNRIYTSWIAKHSTQGAQYASANSLPLIVDPGVCRPDTVITWAPIGTGAEIIFHGTLREVQIDLRGTLQRIVNPQLAGTSDETSAADYGIRFATNSSDNCIVDGGQIRDRGIGIDFPDAGSITVGDNKIIGTHIRDCTQMGMRYAAKGSNSIIGVTFNANTKNLEVTRGGEAKFSGCRFGITRRRGDDKNVHIKGTAESAVVEDYWTHCTFTTVRPNGRVLDITGVTDAGGGRVEITTSQEHKLATGYSDSLKIVGTTSYNITSLSGKNFEVTGKNTFEIDATYVASETGELELPSWDLYIESEDAGDIAAVNDMFFYGGNANYIYIKSAYKVQFLGTRLKTVPYIEDRDAPAAKGSNRVLMVGDFRGRWGPNDRDDVPVLGSRTGWGQIGSFVPNGTLNPGDMEVGIKVPNNSSAVNANGIPDVNTMMLTESGKFRVDMAGTTVFEISADGHKTLIHGQGPDLTIASGEITVTHTWHRVFGEGGAADTLTAINGTVKGQKVMLQAANNAQAISLIDDGVGRLSANRTLSSTRDIITLLNHNGSEIIEVSFSDNS